MAPAKDHVDHQLWMLATVCHLNVTVMLPQQLLMLKLYCMQGMQVVNNSIAASTTMLQRCVVGCGAPFLLNVSLGSSGEAFQVDSPPKARHRLGTHVAFEQHNILQGSSNCCLSINLPDGVCQVLLQWLW